jgi:hypothetical protein
MPFSDPKLCDTFQLLVKVIKKSSKSLYRNVHCTVVLYKMSPCVSSAQFLTVCQEAGSEYQTVLPPAVIGPAGPIHYICTESLYISSYHFLPPEILPEFGPIGEARPSS